MIRQFVIKFHNYDIINNRKIIDIFKKTLKISSIKILNFSLYINSK